MNLNEMQKYCKQTFLILKKKTNQMKFFVLLIIENCITLFINKKVLIFNTKNFCRRYLK